MIVAFLVFLRFSVVFFFTNFDSVYFRFDLTLFTFRLLNFVIDIPSYQSCYLKQFLLRLYDEHLSLEPKSLHLINNTKGVIHG